MDFDLWKLREKEKICCIDIDGVLLSVYPQCWIDFVNSKLKTKFNDLFKMKNTVPYDIYRKLKNEYRTCGIKETFKADEDAEELTKSLKKLGYTILIMSARPVKQYPSLYIQTTNWLNKNKISYDCVYYGEKDKHAKILMEISHLKFMIEDNSMIASQISKWGYKVFLLNNKYNKKAKTEKNVIRINKLREVLKYIK